MDKVELILDGMNTGFDLLRKLLNILFVLSSFVVILALAPLWVPALLLGLVVNKMKGRP